MGAEDAVQQMEVNDAHRGQGIRLVNGYNSATKVVIAAKCICPKRFYVLAYLRGDPTVPYVGKFRDTVCTYSPKTMQPLCLSICWWDHNYRQSD